MGKRDEKEGITRKELQRHSISKYILVLFFLFFKKYISISGMQSYIGYFRFNTLIETETKGMVARRKRVWGRVKRGARM